jgi:hypothetical protein
LGIARPILVGHTLIGLATCTVDDPSQTPEAHVVPFKRVNSIGSFSL